MAKDFESLKQQALVIKMKLRTVQTIRNVLVECWRILLKA